MIEATRRLAAIMSADVAGYSRLMGEDEGGTISALDECFPVIRRHFETYNSRLVETADDSVLAAFESVVEAVQCAIAAQSGLAELNAQRSEDRRMLFRVGVNWGDIVLQAERAIYAHRPPDCYREPECQL